MNRDVSSVKILLCNILQHEHWVGGSSEKNKTRESRIFCFGIYTGIKFSMSKARQLKKTTKSRDRSGNMLKP